MKVETSIAKIMQNHVPAAAVSYCCGLWQRYQFDFVATRPRASKLGDFYARPQHNERITVNANLNVYNFLITYLHEVAHLEVHRQYKRRQPPHGQAWKTHFHNLLLPVMNESVFPMSVLAPLYQYSLNPKARTGADLALMTALRAFDPTPQNLTSVANLAEGTCFVYRQKTYQKNTTNRTTAVCTQQTTQRKYRFSLLAMVEVI